MFVAFNSVGESKPVSEDLYSKFLNAAQNRDTETLEYLVNECSDNTDLLFSIYKFLGEFLEDDKSIFYSLEALKIRQLSSIYCTMLQKAILLKYPSIAKYCLSKIEFEDVKTKYSPIVKSLISDASEFTKKDIEVKPEVSFTIDNNLSKLFKKVFDLCKSNDMKTLVQIEYKIIEKMDTSEDDENSEMVGIRSSKRLKQADPILEPNRFWELVAVSGFEIQTLESGNYQDFNYKEYISQVLNNYKQFHKKKFSTKSDFYNWCISFKSIEEIDLNSEELLKISESKTLADLVLCVTKLGIKYQCYAEILSLFPNLSLNFEICEFLMKSIVKIFTFVQQERIPTIHPFFQDYYYSLCAHIFQQIDNDPKYLSLYNDVVYDHFTKSVNTRYIKNIKNWKLEISPIIVEDVRNIDLIRSLDARPSLLSYCVKVLQESNLSGFYHHVILNDVILYLLNFFEKLETSVKNRLKFYLFYVLRCHPQEIVSLQMVQIFKKFVIVLLRQDIQIFESLHDYLNASDLCHLLQDAYQGIDCLLKQCNTLNKKIVLCCYYQSNIFEEKLHDFVQEKHRLTNAGPVIQFLETLPILDFNGYAPCSFSSESMRFLRQALKNVKNTAFLGLLSSLEMYSKLQNIYKKQFSIFKHPSQNYLQEVSSVIPIAENILRSGYLHIQVKEILGHCYAVKLIGLLSQDPSLLLKDSNQMIATYKKFNGLRLKCFQSLHLLSKASPFNFVDSANKVLKFDNEMYYDFESHSLDCHAITDLEKFIKLKQILKHTYNIALLEYMAGLEVPLDYRIKFYYLCGKYANGAQDPEICQLLKTSDNLYEFCINSIKRLLLEDTENWQYRANYFMARLLEFNDKIEEAFHIFDQTQEVLKFYITPDEMCGKYNVYYYNINDYRHYLKFKNKSGLFTLKNKSDALLNTSCTIFALLKMIEELPTGEKRTMAELLEITKDSAGKNIFDTKMKIVTQENLVEYIKFAKMSYEEVLDRFTIKSLEYAMSAISRLLSTPGLTRDEVLMVFKSKNKNFINKK
eukprot:NODE_57_length_28844_cov_0.352687.p1 type:complete len:1027 gc:universal NODE_57_length_28844_cov_0.352687:8425-5345(-)